MNENETPDVEDRNDGVMSFDEAPEEVPVEIKGKDGTVRKYVLKEMRGEDVTAWMTIVNSRVKTDYRGRPKGKPDFDKFMSALIALCLYDCTTGQRVSKEVIDGWKSKTQTALFHKCRQMNGLDDEAAEAVKND